MQHHRLDSNITNGHSNPADRRILRRLDDDEAIAHANSYGEGHFKLWRVSEAGDELIHEGRPEAP
jgi:hypothetical protein